MTPMDLIGWILAIGLAAVVTIIIITIALALSITVVSGVNEAVSASRRRREEQS